MDDDPWISVMLYWPRVRNVTVVPGMSAARAVEISPETGISSSASRLSTNATRLLMTSTVGEVAVTVSVSSIAPT